MELNQDEDAGSSSMKKEKQESDVFGMWVELKMPAQGDDGSVDIGDQKLGFGKEDEMKNNSMKRVCEICEKEFRSGKALGGHMSSHVQLKKNMRLKKEEEEEGSDFEGKKEYDCAICDKGFASMKALSGHMRCHPERPWRGINPPPPKTTHSDPPMEEFVDLTESLTRWPVTAKRGRKAIPAEEDPLSDAVNFLMMLARGEGGVRRRKDEGSVDRFGEGEVVEIKVVEMRKQEQKEKEGNESELEDDDGDYKSSSGSSKVKLMMKNKKRRKKVKLCDLSLMESSGHKDLSTHNSFDSSLTQTGILNIDLNELPSW